jgi:hypothetical protein
MDNGITKRDLTDAMAGMEKQFDLRLDDAFTRFSQHILHEVGTRFDEVNARLTSIDSRLGLQAGLIQSGARAMVRFSEFAENSEVRWVALVERVAAIEKKLEAAEGKA